MKKIILIFLMSLICFSVMAQTRSNTVVVDKNLEARTRIIADQLRCPVCRGIPISESPAELAQNMMRIIREQLKEGKSNEEIFDYFVSRYGDWILLKPKAQGMNLMIWTFPFLLLLGGVIFLYFAVKKWTRNP